MGTILGRREIGLRIVTTWLRHGRAGVRAYSGERRWQSRLVERGR